MVIRNINEIPTNVGGEEKLILNLPRHNNRDFLKNLFDKIKDNNLGNNIIALDLSDNNFGNLPSADLDNLKELLGLTPNLYYLNLSQNTFHNFPDKLLDNITNKNELVYLNLSNCSINQGQINEISQKLLPNKNLKFLVLGANKLGPEGAYKIAENLKNSKLYSLNLQNNNIGHKGAEELAKNLPDKLIHLSLKWNEIGAHGVKWLAYGIKEHNNLKTLDVTNSENIPTGESALSDALEVNTTLDTLEVSKKISKNLESKYLRSRVTAVYYPEGVYREALLENGNIDTADEILGINASSEACATEGGSGNFIINLDNNNRVNEVAILDKTPYIPQTPPNNSNQRPNEPDITQLPQESKFIYIQELLREGNTAVINNLIRDGRLNPEELNNNGKSFCHWLLQNNREVLTQTIDKIINNEIYNSLITAKDRAGNTLLHYAAKAGNLDFTQRLIDARVDPDICDNKGKTALHYAAKAGNYELISLLVKKVDLEIKDKNGQTALHILVKSNQVENLREIYTNNPIVFKLSCDVKDKEGKTALHYAAIKGNYELIKLLLEKGVDPKIKDNNGQTALHILVESNQVENLRKIFANNPVAFKLSCKVKDMEGKTVLHYAAKAGNYELAQRLLDAGIDPDICDNKGKTALHYAAIKGNYQLAQRLIDAGIDPDICDNKGKTALHYAIDRRDIGLIKLLCRNEADSEIVKNYADEITNYFIFNNSYTTTAFEENVSSNEEVTFQSLSGDIITNNKEAIEENKIVITNQTYWGIIKLFSKGIYFPKLIDLEQIMSLHNDLELLLLQAEGYFRIDKNYIAQSFAEEILENNLGSTTNHFEARKAAKLIKAKCLLRLSEFEKARKFLEKCNNGLEQFNLEQTKEYKLVYFKCLYYLGEIEAAKAELNEIGESDRLDCEALILKGNIRFQENRYDEALNLYSEASVILGEQHPLILINKSLAQCKNGERESALDNQYKAFYELEQLLQNNNFSPINLEAIIYLCKNELRQKFHNISPELSENQISEIISFLEANNFNLQFSSLQIKEITQTLGCYLKLVKLNKIYYDIRSKTYNSKSTQLHQEQLHIDKKEAEQIINEYKNELKLIRKIKSDTSSDENLYKLKNGKIEFYNDNAKNYYATFINVFNYYYSFVLNKPKKSSGNISDLSSLIPVPMLKETVNIILKGVETLRDIQVRLNINTFLKIANKVPIQELSKKLAKKIIDLKQDKIKNIEETKNQSSGLFDKLDKIINAGRLEYSCDNAVEQLAFKDASVIIAKCFYEEWEVTVDNVEYKLLAFAKSEEMTMGEVFEQGYNQLESAGETAEDTYSLIESGGSPFKINDCLSKIFHFFASCKNANSVCTNGNNAPNNQGKDGAGQPETDVNQQRSGEVGQQSRAGVAYKNSDYPQDYTGHDKTGASVLESETKSTTTLAENNYSLPTSMPREESEIKISSMGDSADQPVGEG